MYLDIILITGETRTTCCTAEWVKKVSLTLLSTSSSNIDRFSN